MTKALIVSSAFVLPPIVCCALAAISRAFRKRRQRARTIRTAVRTDNQMLSSAFQLSLLHFRAMNELRKLGGWQ